MSVIVRNDYGAVAVNKGVIETMIVEDLLDMREELLLCSKKGKPIKDKPTPIIDPDYFDAIEVSEKTDDVNVKVYITVRSGNNISTVAEEIFDRIEYDYDLLRLGRPATITVKVKGIMSDELNERNIDVMRNNV